MYILVTFTGKAAVEANNLFYYLTYPGSVNLESLEDIALKKVAKYCYAFCGCFSLD